MPSAPELQLEGVGPSHGTTLRQRRSTLQRPFTLVLLEEGSRPLVAAVWHGPASLWVKLAPAASFVVTVNDEPLLGRGPLARQLQEADRLRILQDGSATAAFTVQRKRGAKRERALPESLPAPGVGAGSQACASAQPITAGVESPAKRPAPAAAPGDGCEGKTVGDNAMSPPLAAWFAEARANRASLQAGLDSGMTPAEEGVLRPPTSAWPVPPLGDATTATSCGLSWGSVREAADPRSEWTKRMAAAAAALKRAPWLCLSPAGQAVYNPPRHLDAWAWDTSGARHAAACPWEAFLRHVDGALAAEVDSTDHSSASSQATEAESPTAPSGPGSQLDQDRGGAVANGHLIPHIQALAQHEASASGPAATHRLLAHRLLLAVLHKLRKRITTAAQVDTLLQFFPLGDGTRTRLCSILQSGTLPKAAALQADPAESARQRLIHLHGIGHATAASLVQTHAVADPADLLQCVQRAEGGRGDARDAAVTALLSAPTLAALPYYADLAQRIPRAEVAVFQRLLRHIVACEVDPQLEVVVAGSFRRGAAWCGDVDVLITHPSGPCQVLSAVCSALSDAGILQCTLHAEGGSGRSGGGLSAGLLPGHHPVQTLAAIARLPAWVPAVATDADARAVPLESPPSPCNTHWLARRLDIKCYHRAHWAPALAYYTGDDMLNRKLREFASRMGYKLDDRYLWPAKVVGSVPGSRGTAQRRYKLRGHPIALESEEDLWSALGLQFIPPASRCVLPVSTQGVRLAKH